jgi:hypothetical protein
MDARGSKPLSRTLNPITVHSFDLSIPQIMCRGLFGLFYLWPGPVLETSGLLLLCLLALCPPSDLGLRSCHKAGITFPWPFPVHDRRNFHLGTPADFHFFLWGTSRIFFVYFCSVFFSIHFDRDRDCFGPPLALFRLRSEKAPAAAVKDVGESQCICAFVGRNKSDRRF